MGDPSQGDHDHHLALPPDEGRRNILKDTECPRAVLNIQMIDLSKKEHKMYLDSTDVLEQETERLCSELDKLPKDTEIPLRVNSITYFGTNRANQDSIKMQGEEQRPVQNENEQTGQCATYENFGCYRSQIPIWPGRGNVVRTESSYRVPQRPSRDREPIADGRSPSPQDVHSAYYSNFFPKRNTSDVLSSNVCALEERPLPSLGSPFPETATEKFLQEEEKRARDLEKVLNSHIDELKRQSESTLKKYSSLKQSQPMSLEKEAQNSSDSRCTNIC